MLGLKTKDFVEVEVVKFIEDLRGTDDLLVEPRSLSPDQLKEACNNIGLNFSKLVDIKIELSLNFLLRNFFYLMHQTGLYNPQRRVWTLLAQTKKIKIKEYKKIPKKEKDTTKIYDAILEDSFGKYAIARIVLPGSRMELPGLNELLSVNNNRCVALFYLSPEPYPDRILAKIREKTNNQDFYDKYKSPINENCSLDLFQYSSDESQVSFKLVHPNLAKEVESTLCFAAS